jgi:hypothetical protein
VVFKHIGFIFILNLIILESKIDDAMKNIEKTQAISSNIGQDNELLEFRDYELMSKLDSLKGNNSHIKYSDIYLGGIQALRENNRINNPDWMAQSANSFREILYIFSSNKEKLRIVDNHYEKYFTKEESEKYSKYIKTLYGLFTDIAHHFCSRNNLDKTIKINENFAINLKDLNEESYFEIIRLYKQYLNLLIATAVEIHERIDKCIKDNLKSKEEIKILIGNSDDSRMYFYSKANEEWIDWLWENEFLNVLSMDGLANNYRMPELTFLMNMAEKAPDSVTKVINSTKFSKESCNIEVITYFLWIISSLPAQCIKILTPKIRDEQWVYLMKDYDRPRFECEKIVEELTNNDESQALLEIAEAILIVKSDKEDIEDRSSPNSDNQFYVNDLNSTGIFEAVSNIEKSYSEKALQILCNTLTAIIEQKDSDDKGMFEYNDFYSLYELDLFKTEVKKERYGSFRGNLKNLVSSITILVERVLQETDVNPHKALSYIEDLPSCRTAYRLKLFTLAQNPQIFSEKLKVSFFTLFESDNIFELIGGTEYKNTLKKGFAYLNSEDQRKYISQVIELFSKKSDENPEKNLYKKNGLEILSCICNYLTKYEKTKCEELFGEKCIDDFEPKPLFWGTRAGAIKHESPITNIESYKVEEIISNLRSKWVEGKIEEQFPGDDHFTRRGIEGLSLALQEDIKNRFKDYIINIENFFDIDIHPHHIYSLLRSILAMAKDNSLSIQDVSHITRLFEKMMVYGETAELSFDSNNRKNWIEVYKVIPDIIVYVLENEEIERDVMISHRQVLFTTISFLLDIKESPSQEKSSAFENLHGIAINSIRGEAYTAFEKFIEKDGEILAEDVKELYARTLKDHSLAVRFMVGRYLPFFYFRDNEFVKNLLPQIFPIGKSTSKEVYFATWGGYLLYEIVFLNLLEEFSDYYRYAIEFEIDESEHPKEKEMLDKSLAGHFALAYSSGDLKLDDELLINFFKIKNQTRFKHFISTIGRSYLSYDNVTEEWLIEKKVDKNKLIEFWNFAVESDLFDENSLSSFGYWINPNVEVLEDATVIHNIYKTLVRSYGRISWEYALLKRLPLFAARDAEKTLDILNIFLFDSQKNINRNRRSSYLHADDLKTTLQVIYQNGNDFIKHKVRELVNTLISKASSSYWRLKDIF